MTLDTDEEAGKLFIGGLSWETSEEKLSEYFSRYGHILDCVVMKNMETGRSRGFGFITFKDPNCVQLVLQNAPHTLDHRTIDPKCCNSKSAQKFKREAKLSNYPKVFLGGLPQDVNETALRQFFSKYGKVIEVVIMYDQERKKSKGNGFRGFGFLTFENEESVNKVVGEHFVLISGKKVEVKKAEPREKISTPKTITTATQPASGLTAPIPSWWPPPSIPVAVPSTSLIGPSYSTNWAPPSGWVAHLPSQSARIPSNSVGYSLNGNWPSPSQGPTPPTAIPAPVPGLVPVSGPSSSVSTQSGFIINLSDSSNFTNWNNPNYPPQGWNNPSQGFPYGSTFPVTYPTPQGGVPLGTSGTPLVINPVYPNQAAQINTQTFATKAIAPSPRAQVSGYPQDVSNYGPTRLYAYNNGYNPLDVGFGNAANATSRTVQSFHPYRRI